MAATKNQSAYEQLLTDFDAAQSAYERAKTQEVTAKHQLKTIGKSTTSKLEHSILQLQYEQAKHKRKSRKAALKIAKMSITLWLKNNTAAAIVERAAPVVIASVEVAAEPERKRRGPKPKEKTEVVKVAKAPKAAKAVKVTEESGEKKRRGRPVRNAATEDSTRALEAAAEPEGKASAGVMEEPATERALLDASGKRPRRSSAEIAAEKAAEKANLQGDDFTVIEGIGMKVMAFLHNNGYYSFTDLAESKVTDLVALLKAARNNIANPATWAEQARLVAEGRMEELNALKATIKYGKKA